ncbi:MAG: hypothetical protein WD232_00130 [Acidimicrobiales bacterium]
MGDEATTRFADVVVATLADPSGWTGAGFTFTFSDDAPHTIVLAEEAAPPPAPPPRS